MRYNLRRPLKAEDAELQHNLAWRTEMHYQALQRGVNCVHDTKFCRDFMSSAVCGLQRLCLYSFTALIDLSAARLARVLAKTAIGMYFTVVPGFDSGRVNAITASHAGGLCQRGTSCSCCSACCFAASLGVAFCQCQH